MVSETHRIGAFKEIRLQQEMGIPMTAGE